jgi:hypothetical protein
MPEAKTQFLEAISLGVSFARLHFLTHVLFLQNGLQAPSFIINPRVFINKVL